MQLGKKTGKKGKIQNLKKRTYTTLHVKCATLKKTDAATIFAAKKFMQNSETVSACALASTSIGSKNLRGDDKIHVMP